jgi:hydroxymethylglutaryl-CoA reductase (NADPH)
MKLAGDVVLEAVDQVGNGILRDYALEIAVLLVGASSHVGGLREFCALAVLVLTLDCFMLSTFYTAILAVMIEVSSFDHGTFPRRFRSRFHRPITSLLTTITTIYLSGSKNKAGQVSYQISP